MARRRYDVQQFLVQYGNARDSEERVAIEDAAKQLIKDGAHEEVHLNQHIDDGITLVPSVPALLNTAYSIIDSELRGLNGTTRVGGMNSEQSRHFERLISSVVRLHKAELELRSKHTLEALDDEELRKLASEAFKKLEQNLQRDHMRTQRKARDDA